MAWELYLTDEVDGWLNDLAETDRDSYVQVVAGIEVLARPQSGPPIGGPDQQLTPCTT